MIRFNCSILLLHYCHTKRKAQHCVKSCIFGVILSAFSRIRNANAGKCGPELLRIRTLFTHANPIVFMLVRMFHVFYLAIGEAVVDAYSAEFMF